MKLIFSKYAILSFLVGLLFLSVSAQSGNHKNVISNRADTKGGYGGKIIKVTNLNAQGPGSFFEAVRTKGKRIVVFEISGVIDLNATLITIRDPYLTIAGQTAPSPGITIINGGLLITAHDVIVQHIRVRPGNNGRKDLWSSDAISTKGAHNVIIDHCSLSWAIDENLSASGPRFQGKTPDEWRKNTSHRITFSNNIIAEGLRYSTHEYGEHSKGTLIHDNVTDVLIQGNLYADNVDRNPYMKGGSRGVVINNYIYNPGKAAMRYLLADREWGFKSRQTGKWSIVGNVMELGYDSKNIAMMDIGSGPAEIYIKDNIGININGRNTEIVSGDKSKLVKDKPIWFENLREIKSGTVKAFVLENAGARPWDRDENDKRIVNGVINKTGRMIDDEKEVGGYPKVKSMKKSFNENEWDFKELYSK